MKLSIPYDLFEAAVSNVNANPVVINTANDVCQYILIETDDGNTGVVLTKTDLDVQIISKTKATVEEPGRTLVHGESLAKILKTYKNLKKSDDCQVFISSDDSKITIGFSDNKKYKPAVLSVRDPEDFAPVEEFEDEIASCEVMASYLKDYFTKNLVAINKHETTAENKGVFFKFKNDKIELVSSNRQEVAIIVDTPLSITFQGGRSQAFALIPRKTLEIVTRIVHGGDPVRVSVSQENVQVSGECDGVGFAVLNSTISVKAPIDSESVLLTNPTNIVSIPTAELRNAISHMEAIMDKSVPNRITILVDPAIPDTVMLSCKSPTGEIPGLPISAKIEKATTAESLILNDQRIGSLLKTIRSRNITLSFVKTGDACMFSGDEEPYFKMVASSLNAEQSIAVTVTKPTAKVEAKAAPSDIQSFDDLSDMSASSDFESDLDGIQSIEI